MLVLSRHKKMTVRIVLPDGRTVDVVVVDIRGDKVRLGFDAPPDVGVHRLEIYEAIERDGGSMTQLVNEGGAS